MILAVPALNWMIVNHSWHYAFGALGIVGLMWVVAWLILGKEGPLVQTAAMAANEPRIPYFQLLTSRTFHRLLSPRPSAPIGRCRSA